MEAVEVWVVEMDRCGCANYAECHELREGVEVVMQKIESRAICKNFKEEECGIYRKMVLRWYG